MKNFTRVFLYTLSPLVAGLCLIGSLYAEASPVPKVMGKTISVADDGWYQFQRADDFTEVCAGVFNCTVEPGVYIVINHTTGERWEDVQVPGTVDVAQPVVSGHHITMSETGWWQVLHNTSFVEACAGVSACHVPDGIYIIIEHQSGTRFEGIKVPAPERMLTGLDSQRYSLTAGELFWQPLDAAVASIYEIYRNGTLVGQTNGRSFFDSALPDNRSFEYRIVTQLDGETVHAEITLPAFDDSHQQPFLQAGNAGSILREVVAVINEEPFDVFFEKMQQQFGFDYRRFTLPIHDGLALVQSITSPDDYAMQDSNHGSLLRLDEYSCASGGSLLAYFSIPGALDRDYLFDNCALDSRIFNGTHGFRFELPPPSISATGRYPFYNFSIRAVDGSLSSLSGEYAYDDASDVMVADRERWADAQLKLPTLAGPVEIDSFTASIRSDSGYVIPERVRNPEMDADNPLWILVHPPSSSINGSFQIRAPWTQMQTLTVDYNLHYTLQVEQFSEDLLDANARFKPLDLLPWHVDSRIEVNADDGSTIIATPGLDGEEAWNLSLWNEEVLGPFNWDDGFTVNCRTPELCGS